MKSRILQLSILLAVFSVPTWVVGEPDISYLGPFGGDVRSLAIHPKLPDRIFLGTSDGQIFISRNRGATWSRSEGLERRKLVLDSIVFDPGNPDVIYVGGWEIKRDRGQLFRSTDGGESWARVSMGSEYNSSVRAVAVSPVDSRLIAVGITEGVMLSRDGGLSWDRISRGYRSMHNVHSLAFDPQERETLYVGTFRLGWKTENLGRKWDPLKTGIYWDSDFFSIQINPVNRSNVIIGACSGFYRSIDKGDTWERIRNGLPDEAKRTRAVAFNPNDPDIVFAGTTAGLYRSSNNGLSWKRVLEDTIVNSIIVHPTDSEQVLIGTDDIGVLVSRDGGLNFSASNQGFSHRQVAAVAQKISNPSRKIYIAVAMDREYGGFFFSTDLGETWTQYNQGLGKSAPWISSILPSTSSDSVFVVTRDGVYSGIPGAQEWKIFSSTGNIKVNQIAFSGPGEKQLLVAADQGLFLLDLEKNQLQRLETGIYTEEIFTVATFGPKSFAGTRMGVFSSSDQGRTWTIDVDGLPYTAVRDFTGSGKTVYCTTDEGIFKTDLSDSKWVPGTLDHDNPLPMISAGNRSMLFTADSSHGHLFFSPDQGQSWQSLDLVRVISDISCLSGESEDFLLAGTISEGLVKIKLPGLH